MTKYVIYWVLYQKTKFLWRFKMETKYEQFQQWLNECPVEIIDYVDNTETFDVKFLVPLEQSVPVEEVNTGHRRKDLDLL